MQAPASSDSSTPPVKKLEIIIVIAVILLGAAYYFYYKQTGLSGPFSKGGITQSIDNFNKNNLDAAIKSADGVLANNPNNIEALLAKSASLAQKGSLSFREEEFGTQAIAVTEQVLAVDSTNAEAWRIKGYAYESMEQYDQAFAAYNKAILLDPQNALAYSTRGHAYYLTGESAKAKADYQKALSLDPNLTHALINIGRVFITEGNYTGAIANLNKAVPLESNLRFKAEAEQLLGTAYNAQGEFATARAHFQNALDYDATLATAWVGLANATFLSLPTNMPDNQAARDDFNQKVGSIFAALEKATQINPNQTSAYIITGRLLGTLGSTDAALDVLKHALTIVDTDITLGAVEKNLVRQTINDDIAFISR